MNHRFQALIAGGVGLALLPASAMAQETCGGKDFPASLVRIERGPNRTQKGTGVVIVRREDYVVILSAKHVMGADNEDFSIWFQVEPNRRVAARLDRDAFYAVSPNSDIVAFRVNARIPEGVVAEDPLVADPSPGAPLAAWGYPIVRDGVLCGHQRTLARLQGGLLVLDRDVAEGVSGGPVFLIDEKSKVSRLAGIVTSGDAGSGYAIDIREAKTLMSTSSDAANGNKPYVWPNIPLRQVLQIDVVPNLSFRRVDGGEFVMGSTVVADERWPAGRRPSLPVFFMGTYEVTRAQYQECVRDNACRSVPQAESTDPQAANLPVVNVTWEDATRYTRWLQERLTTRSDTPRDVRRLFDAGWTVVLPSEAEWERAARKDGSAYPWGPNASNGDVNVNTGRLRPVDRSRCGGCAFGLFDMAGNVREWTRSLKLPYPYDAARAELPDAPGNRVVRGGSYRREENALFANQLVRSANRQDAPRTSADQYTGFRVALICARDTTSPCSWQQPD